MCIVSNISDHYQGNTGDWQQPKTYPYYPDAIPMPDPPTIKPFDWQEAISPAAPWTKEALDMLKELIERTKKLDEKLGLPDCEDPKKAEWMQEIERRLKALEAEKGGE